jgi:hypothetical protein
MKIEVSIGEIVDKISILEIKVNEVKGDKYLNVRKELEYLKEQINTEMPDFDWTDMYKLYHINKRLWDIEDEIRVKESKREFDDDFVDLARSVYYVNDERAEVKKEINLKYNSMFVEEKSYKPYKHDNNQ